MIDSAADDRQIADVHWEEPILDMTQSRPRTQIKYFEVAMSIHPNLVLATLHQEEHVEGTPGVEVPNVDAFGIDLGFDQGELILARIPRKAQTAWRRDQVNGRPRDCGIFETFTFNGRLGRFPRFGHGELHIGMNADLQWHRRNGPIIRFSARPGESDLN